MTDHLYTKRKEDAIKIFSYKIAGNAGKQI